jgi:uncharacterized lipoprotein YmbA
MKFILLIIAALLLAGCATWTHPTKKGQEALDADSYECDKDGAAVQDDLRRLVMKERCLKLKGWKPS